MSIIHQKDATENCSAAVKNLIRLLAVPVSRKTLEEVKYRKDYPSLLAVSAMLSEWNMNNLAIRIDSKKLVEVPLPAIAHLRKNSGHFVVLTRHNGDRLQYIDPESGMVEESICDFEQKWDGVVLLASKTDNSGETQYREKRKEEIVEHVTQYVTGFLAIASLACTFWFVTMPLFVLLFVKGFGCTLSVLLILKQFGGKNAILDSICNINPGANCNAVIQSPASSIFGYFHVSELGLIYFVGGFLTILIGGSSQTNVMGWLLLVTSLGVLYSAFSVHYQWVVVRAWCPLCLLVMAVIWIEESLIIGLMPSFHISWKATTIFVLGFSISTVFWLVIRKRLIDSFRVAAAERANERIMKSEKVFSFLMSAQPPTEMANSDSDIVLGQPSAMVEITIVSNPLCGPCATAHAIVERLLNRFEGKLRVIYRFVIDPKGEEPNALQMVEHIVGLALTSPNCVAKALSQWYNGEGKSNPERWIRSHPISELGDQQLTKEIVNKQIDWARRAGIKSTPTLFLNGKQVPEEYSLNDLAYQMGKLLR